MPDDPKNPRFHHLIALSLIVITAAALRLHALTRYSLSYDELGTLETVAGRGQIHLTIPHNVLLSPPPRVTTERDAAPAWRIPLVMRSDVHPPLYFILLRLWLDIFGDSDAAAKMLSVVAGVLSVALIFDVGRWWHNPATGLWAALLMAVALPQIIESRDARPYALATLLLLAAIDALLRIQRLGNTRRRSLALGISLTAVCLTHYFVLPAVIAIGVYAPIAKQRRLLGVIAIAMALAGLLWGWGLWQQRGNFSDPWMYWMTDAGPHHIALTLERAAALPLRFLADPMGTPATLSIAAVIYVLPWLLCRRRPEMILTGLWLIGCVGLATALDLFRGTQQLSWVKYTLLAAPAVYLMLASLIRGALGHLLPAAAVLFCVMNLGQAYPGREVGYTSFAYDLNRLASPKQIVVLCGSGWGAWYTGRLYMDLERYAKPMPPAVALLNAPLPPKLLADLADIARQTGGLWFVCWTNKPPEDLLPGWQVEKTVNYSAAVRLYELIPPQ
jgi:hypothetical protein